MADYTLYCDSISGNCYKVALFLALAGLDWKPEFVDYEGGATRTDAYKAGVNELGEIPVLEHKGVKRSQSGAILTWLAESTGQFGPRTEEERFEVLRWLLYDNHKFTSYYATLRFLYGVQKGADTPVTEFLRGRSTTAWGIVDKHLASRPFILGDRLTIADLSMAGYVFYPEPTGMDRALYPHIASWMKRIAAMSGWKHPYELLPGKGKI